MMMIINSNPVDEAYGDSACKASHAVDFSATDELFCYKHFVR